MESSCSHVVFLLYEALFYFLGIFQLSSTKFCANLKMCNFSIREVFPWVRSIMCCHICDWNIVNCDAKQRTNEREVTINFLLSGLLRGSVIGKPRKVASQISDNVGRSSRATQRKSLPSATVAFDTVAEEDADANRVMATVAMTTPETRSSKLSDDHESEDEWAQVKIPKIPGSKCYQPFNAESTEIVNQNH